MSNIPVLHNPHPSYPFRKKNYKLALDVLTPVKYKTFFFLIYSDFNCFISPGWLPGEGLNSNKT